MNHHLKFFIRCVYVIVIIALFYWLTHDLGANPKNYSEIKTSIKMLMTDQPVDSDKRLHVSNFFSHRFSAGRREILGFDPVPVLQKIRAGEKLNDGDKQQLSKMLSICSELSSP
jgi:hypothetical protein